MYKCALTVSLPTALALILLDPFGRTFYIERREVKNEVPIATEVLTFQKVFRKYKNLLSTHCAFSYVSRLDYEVIGCGGGGGEAKKKGGSFAVAWYQAGSSYLNERALLDLLMDYYGRRFGMVLEYRRGPPQTPANCSPNAKESL
ncbi:hypothetical protein PM082_021458 [Marasmius tenuissimus]|nr:hypothetical protein PM082_021458 [Marasmius tenuissimus]